MSEILVVHMDPNSGAQENGTKLFKSFNNGEKLLFDSRMITLGGIELSGIIGHGAAALFDNRAKLIFAGVCLHIKRQRRASLAALAVAMVANECARWPKDDRT